MGSLSGAFPSAIPSVTRQVWRAIHHVFHVVLDTLADAPNALILEVIEHHCFPFCGGLGFTAKFQVTDGGASNASTQAGQDIAASFPDSQVKW